MEKVVVGIDYSMVSPGICVCRGDTFSFDRCEFHFLTSKKNLIGYNSNSIYGTEYPTFKSFEDRANEVSEWAVNIVGKADVVCIEGYAMAAKGLVFNIGEFTGLLKHKLWLLRDRKPLCIVAPTSNKKFATGKGNADKEKMYEAFLEETGCDLKSLLTPKQKSGVGNPTSDLVDAYYLCKWGYSN